MNREFEGLIRKISAVVMKVILSCASIWLMFMACIGDGDIANTAIIIAIMWFVALHIDEEPNMIWRLLLSVKVRSVYWLSLTISLSAGRYACYAGGV